MPIDFYYMTGSPPCYTILLLGKTLGLEFNMKYIDYHKKDHKTPEYEKMCPQQTVPLINDNGFLISESRPILCYLVEKYAKDDSLYPKDIKKRTIINHRLFFDIGTLYQGFLDYYICGFDVSKYSNVSKWFTKMKKNLPGYEETVGAGTVDLRKFLGL
ncbi:Glutathione S-transferase 1-1 [Blattella germanica]|nr:Glutathione S-transferase 1-1 [Blattella germanica]